jgi:putative polyhydroxyalkanoate system protein
VSRIAAACPQTLPRAEARRRAEAFARQMGRRFGLEWEWQGDALRFAASSGAARGVRGDLVIGADEVTVSLHVPMWLRLLAGTLADRARVLLRETFAPGTGLGQGSRSIPKRSIIR